MYVKFPLICKDKRTGEQYVALGLATNDDDTKYKSKNTKVVLMNWVAQLSYVSNETTLEHFEVIRLLEDKEDGMQRMKKLIETPARYQNG
jgi:hypothetical protein